MAPSPRRTGGDRSPRDRGPRPTSPVAACRSPGRRHGPAGTRVGRSSSASPKPVPRPGGTPRPRVYDDVQRAARAQPAGADPRPAPSARLHVHRRRASAAGTAPLGGAGAVSSQPVTYGLDVRAGALDQAQPVINSINGTKRP